MKQFWLSAFVMIIGLIIGILSSITNFLLMFIGGILFGIGLSNIFKNHETNKRRSN